MKTFILIHSLFLFLVLSLFSSSNGNIQSSSMCGDETCSKTISKAQMMVSYHANTSDGISVKKGVIVDVVSKSKRRWGIKVNDKIGYAPREILKESLVFIRSEDLQEVPASPIGENKEKLEQPPIPKSEDPSPTISGFASAETITSSEESSPAQEPNFEVIDGTTIYFEATSTISQAHPSANYPSENIGNPNDTPNVPQTPNSLENSQNLRANGNGVKISQTSESAPVNLNLEVAKESKEESVEILNPTSTKEKEEEVPRDSETISNSEPVTETPSTASQDSTSETANPSETQPQRSFLESIASVLTGGSGENVENSAEGDDGDEEEEEEDDENYDEESIEVNTVEDDDTKNDNLDKANSNEHPVNQQQAVLPTPTPPEDTPGGTSSEQPVETTAAPLNEESISAPVEPTSAPLKEEPTGAQDTHASEPSTSQPLTRETPSQSFESKVTPNEEEVVPAVNVQDTNSVPIAAELDAVAPSDNYSNTVTDNSQVPSDYVTSTIEPVSEAIVTTESTPIPSPNDNISSPNSLPNHPTLPQEQGNVNPEQQMNYDSEKIVTPGSVDYYATNTVQAADQITQHNQIPADQNSPNQDASPPSQSYEQPQLNVQIDQVTPNETEERNAEMTTATTDTVESALASQDVNVQSQNQNSLPFDYSKSSNDAKPDNEYQTIHRESEERFENEIPEEVEENSGGLFSWVGGLFGSSNSEESGQLEEEPVVINESQPPLSQASGPVVPETASYQTPTWNDSEEKDGVCTVANSGESCEMLKNMESQESKTDAVFPVELEVPSFDALLTRLAAAALTLLLGILSFYYIQKKRLDSSLVARINELEKQLLVASKEALILREETLLSESEIADPEEVAALRRELETSLTIRTDLEEQVSTLEKELEEATETGIELNRLLSETLEASKGKAHANLVASVERLQQQLNGQQSKVESLTHSLTFTKSENESLKAEVTERKERIAALEVELAAALDNISLLRQEREEIELAATEKVSLIQTQLSSKVLQESRLGSELSALKLNQEKLRSSLAIRDAEVEALQNTIKSLEKGENPRELLDTARLQAELKHLQQERDELKGSLLNETMASKQLLERFEIVEKELKSVQEKYEEAQKLQLEADTRLTVLSNYFKEKETQLQKELGLQEAIVAQHRGDESAGIRHLQLVQEEMESYKAQNDSLKKEILDQERGFKTQIASLEKKAHDNWMAARQAERKLEESRQEAGLLRNRLTLIEKSGVGNMDPNNRLEANGDGGVSPPVMMPLPPLGDSPPPMPPFMVSPLPFPPPFMPPPPMIGRPPPLGRMSPPPPPHHGQFSPPPPLYDRLERSSRSRSPSPPPHRYHHRSPPPFWDEPRSGFRPVPKPSPKKPQPQRDHKGGPLSSGHSNESL